MKKMTNSLAIHNYNRYLRSTDTKLSDVYTRWSTNKQNAYERCIRLMNDMGGRDFRILGHNSDAFSVGFITDEKFIYITRSYDYEYPIEKLQ